MGAAANYKTNAAVVPPARPPGGFNALGQALSPGDVVWCAFPFHTAPRMPGDYARPCLVLEERSVAGRTHYLVAYGTTKNLASEARFPGDIFIAPSDGAHFDATGMDGPGKFRLCQTALLPSVPAYFPRPPFTQASKSGRFVEGVRIGKFTPELIEVLQHSYKEMQEYQAYESLRGFVPSEPLGPLCDVKNMGTGRNFLRRKP